MPGQPTKQVPQRVSYEDALAETALVLEDVVEDLRVVDDNPER